VILVDTSIWVDHLRRGDATLAQLLEASAVAVHPFVIGELACGSLRRGSEVVTLLAELPAATAVSHNEVMRFVAVNRLGGRGIGYVDVHLLASAVVDRVPLWSRDKALHAEARRLGVAYTD
jgi:predicted nucleic acid-binding protein